MNNMDTQFLTETISNISKSCIVFLPLFGMLTNTIVTTVAIDGIGKTTTSNNNSSWFSFSVGLSVTAFHTIITLFTYAISVNVDSFESKLGFLLIALMLSLVFFVWGVYSKNYQNRKFWFYLTQATIITLTIIISLFSILLTYQNN